MRKSVILDVTVYIAVILTIVGCGTPNAVQSSSSGLSGSVRFAIRWQSTPQPVNRLVPQEAQSIVVTATAPDNQAVLLTANGQQGPFVTIQRPPPGQNTSSIVITNLPATTLLFTAKAVPNPDGSGTVEASGSVTVTVASFSTTSVNLTMDSTINKVVLLEAGSLAIRNATTITATTLDSSGAIVLTASANWHWTSDNLKVATISSTGETATITGITAGTANVSATESESGKSAQIAITVLPLIAFIRTNNGTMETYTMYSDGTHITKLTTGDGISSTISWLGSRPSWFPGNNKITYANYQDGTGEIYAMNADGSGQTRLTSKADQSSGPDVSPDGAKIVFARSLNKSAPYQIWVMNADGGNLQGLTTSVGANFAPIWSHDGQHIAFISSRNGINQVFVMNANGSNQTALTNNPNGDDAPSWSPDGSRIVFSRDLSQHRKQLYVMNSNGSGLADISNNATIANIWEDVGAFSPDGRLIGFTTNITGNFEIFSANPDGSGRKQLTTSAPGWSYYPSWSR